MRHKHLEASCSASYSHFQAEMEHTSKDAVTIVTEEELEEVLLPCVCSREQQT